jgi:predicted alpha/beta-hydrolase family hydrolase
MLSERQIPTPQGPGRLVLERAKRPRATLLLSHGAGAGVATTDLTALIAALPEQGITVALFEQPWRVAGRKVASAPAKLDEAFLLAGWALGNPARKPGTPLIVGGRSAGARSAARTARQLGAAGCLALAFPLHPPGSPEKSRLPELAGVEVPTLVIQGEKDVFGGPSEFPEETVLAVVPTADHSLHVPKRSPLSQEDADAIVVQATLEWIERAILGNAPS